MVDGEPHTLEFNCFRTSVVDILRKNGGGMHASRLRYQQGNIYEDISACTEHLINISVWHGYESYN